MFILIVQSFHGIMIPIPKDLQMYN